MKKVSIAVLLFCYSGVSVAAAPDGNIENHLLLIMKLFA